MKDYKAIQSTNYVGQYFLLKFTPNCILTSIYIYGQLSGGGNVCVCVSVPKEEYRTEAVPSINYIGRQLDVSYFGREMYGEISIYQIRI